MPLHDDVPENGFDSAVGELPVSVTVNGTTVMAVYGIEDGAVLLFSADFGDASAQLDGRAPEAVAARLLWGLAEAAMTRSSVPFMRDDEVNAPEIPGA